MPSSLTRDTQPASDFTKTVSDLEGASLDDLRKTFKSESFSSGELSREVQTEIGPKRATPKARAEDSRVDLERLQQLPDLDLKRGGGGAPRAPKAGLAQDIELGALIGKGGMGEVHSARQITLDRTVAVKRSRSGSRALAASRSVLREARLLGSLEHPSIPPVHLLGKDEDGRAVLVMKRIQGESWITMLQNPDHPDWARIHGDRTVWNLNSLVQVAHAIEYAHSRDLIHRDIKTDNVMIGDFGQVYLLDWGLAVPLDGNGLYESRKFSGTPAYAAPEMVCPELDLSPLTDVYLLGATLHELITGKPRHRGKTINEVIASAGFSRPYNYDSDVPGELARICNTAMHRNPKQRFGSARAFREALSGYIEQRTSVALLEAAERLLGELEILQAEPEHSAGIGERIHSLGIECRFAFQQVLHGNPGNPAALSGLARCLHIQVLDAISKDNIQAGRMLHGELSEYSHLEPEDLASLAQQLDDREAALAARQDEMTTQIHHALVERLRTTEEKLRSVELLLNSTPEGEPEP